MPRKYSIPNVGIQGWRSTNWNDSAAGDWSKPAHRASVTPNVTRDTANVRLRMRASFEPSRLPMNSSRKAPSTGRTMASESIGTPVTARYLQK